MEWPWVSLSPVVAGSEIRFQQGECDRGCVRYLCPPLPLLEGSQDQPPTLRHSISRKALHLTCLLNSGNLKLICFSSGSEYSSLSVCSLSEQRNVISTAKDFFSTFEEWSRAHSLLKIARLTTCAVPEQVEQIESVVIGGKKTYLSVTCAHHVMVYEVPVAQSSAASCRWIRNPVTHKFPSKILHTKLSPYIAGEVLILAENGQLFIQQQSPPEVIEVRTGDVDVCESGVCVFGSHPRMVLWVQEGVLHSVDLRLVQFPVSGRLKPLWNKGTIMCTSHDSQKPFHLLVATTLHLMIFDLRQPAEPVLAVPHNLSSPPVALSALHTPHESTLVLLCSVDSSLVFSYDSSYHQSTLPPHAVCTLSEVLRALKRSGVCGLVCSQLGYRFTAGILGAVLLPLSLGSFGVLILTELGDLFWQCWNYSSSSSDQRNLTISQYQGYKLWLETILRKISNRQWEFIPGIVKDMHSIAEYLIGSHQTQDLACVKCFHSDSHIVGGGGVPLPSNPDSSCSTQCHCSSCGCLLPGSVKTGGSQLSTLREMCEQLTPISQLDSTLVTGWEVNDIKHGLFQEES